MIPEAGGPVTASSTQTAFAFDASTNVLELAVAAGISDGAAAVQAAEQPLLVTAVDSIYVGAILSISRNTFLQLGGEAGFAQDAAAFLQLPSSSLVRIMEVADVAAATNEATHGRYGAFTVCAISGWPLLQLVSLSAAVSRPECVGPGLALDNVCVKMTDLSFSHSCCSAGV